MVTPLGHLRNGRQRMSNLVRANEFLPSMAMPQLVKTEPETRFPPGASGPPSRAAGRQRFTSLSGCRSGLTQMPQNEGPLIGDVFDLHPRRLPGAMPRAGLDPHQHRLVAPLGGLHRRPKLVAVPRHDAIIVIRRGHQRRWIAGSLLQVVQWGVGVLRLEFFLHLAQPVVGVPVSRVRAWQVIAQHVQHADRRQRRAEQLGPLDERRRHQQPAVAATLDRQLLARGIAFPDQILGGRDEVVEDVLLTILGPRQVPLLPVLAAPAEVGHRQDAATLDPDEPGEVIEMLNPP